MLGWDLNAHVYMVWQQMAFYNPALLLSRTAITDTDPALFVLRAQNIDFSKI